MSVSTEVLKTKFCESLAGGAGNAAGSLALQFAAPLVIEGAKKVDEYVVTHPMNTIVGGAPLMILAAVVGGPVVGSIAVFSWLAASGRTVASVMTDEGIRKISKDDGKYFRI